MTTNFSSSRLPRAQALSLRLRHSRFVSTQFGITRIRSGGAPFSSSRWRIVSPIATMPVRASQIEADEPAQQADDDRVLEPLELDGDLGEDVLADHDERRAGSGGRRASAMSAMIGGSVMQRTMSGRRPRRRRASALVRYVA